ncbi:hypothetical protein JCM11641_007665 [Rhodosporidiobolus odoratus]
MPRAQPQPQPRPQQDDGRHRLPAPPSLRGQSTSELSKRLKTLHNHLQDFDQDLVDTDSLTSAARDLIHPSLLLHKDKGVKAYVGACLVDILRLYAPDAPYTSAELKDLFDFLIRQFRHVGSVNDPHQAEFFFIVDSLASVKSIVLVCDLDAADELVERIFKECFDTISTTSPKNVEIALSDILLSILDELPSVPPTVVDTLTSQFLPKAIKARPAAFRLATDVCKGASDKLQRYVSQYFGETIMATVEGRVGNGEDESDEEDDDDDSDAGPGGERKRKGKGKGKKKVTKGGEEELSEHFVQAHDLIRSLHRHVPSLLLSVIPQLEAELVTSNPSYRRLATAVLGAMFGEPPGHGDLAREFPATWKEWGRRSKDRDAKVRVAVADRTGRILREHQELGSDIEAILLALLTDGDEKVRLAACTVFEEMDYETAAHHVTRRALETLANRLADKKDKVRAVTFKALGKLYDLAFPEIESRDEGAIRQFGWIPERLLDALKFVGTEGISTVQRHLVDATFSTHILPRPKTEKEAESDLSSWVDRFLLVERHIATPAHKAALMHLTKLAEQREGRNPWESYITTCERWNSGIIDDEDQKEPIRQFLKMTIKAVSANMPEPAKAADDLHNFAKQNIPHMYKELKVMLDPQTDLKTYIKNERDFFRRLEKFPSPTSITQTFTTFLRSYSYQYLSRSSISQLLKRLQAGQSNLPTVGTSASASEADQFAASAERTLEYVSRHRPVVHRSHVAELGKLLGNEAAEGRVVEVALHALAKLKKVDEKVAIESKLAKRVLQFAQSGSNERQAKQAATMIALDQDRPGSVDDLVEHLSTALGAAVDDELPAHFAALARLARYGRDAFENKSEAITEAALEVLVRAGVEGETAEDEDTTWQEDADLDPLTRARVLSIEILVNRCLSYARTESAAKVAKPVFELLWPLLQTAGGGEETYSIPVASRLRLAAGLAILKLLASKDPHYSREIVSRLDLLARLSQDACFEVRDRFLKKLVTYLREKRLHPQVLPRLNMVLFLVAHEPEEELHEAVVHFAKSRKRLPDAERQQLWEAPFLRLVHMLAHHPDFEGEEHEAEDVKTMAKYFELYFDVFVTADNISYLYYLASRVKTVRDKHPNEHNPNLYILSELAQHLLKTIGKRHSWPIQTHPGQVALPSDIFQKIPTADEAKLVAGKTWLDEATLTKLEVKPEKKKTVTRKRASPSSSGGGANGSKPKRPRTTKTTPSKSKPRRKSAAGGKRKDEWESDEDEDEDEDVKTEADEESDPSSSSPSSEGEEDASSDDDDEGSPGQKQKKKSMAVSNGVKKKKAGKSTPSRGQRGNLRSDPKKSVVKGLGVTSDEGEDDDNAEKEEGADDEQADGMDVDAAGGRNGSEEIVVTTANGKSPSKGKKAAPASSLDSRPHKKAAPSKLKSKAAEPSPAKGKAAKKGLSTSASKKAAGAAARKDAEPRRALRGLKQPRALKKMDAEEVSDVGESEDEEMAEGEEDE